MSRQAADFAVVHAHIWSQDAPPAEALAAAEGRIVAVGSDREIADYITPRTRVLNAEGRRVVPGLADAHLHFVPGGLRMRRLDVSGAANRGELAKRVAAYAKRLPAGAWIEGGGWSSDAWAGPPTAAGAIQRGELEPRRTDVDAATGGRPLLLYRVDCHAALVNSAALSAAGIDRHGPADPPGGRIERDRATGDPTGILRDKAMDLVTRVIPPPSQAARVEAIRAAARHALEHGLTMVHTMLDAADIEALGRVRAAGEPFPRMYHILHQRPDAAGIALWRSFQPGDDAQRCGACKNYMDGSLGSRTAWMSAPYADSPETCGLPLDGAAGRQALLDELCLADRAGLQLCAHAIGDAANRELLGLYEEVARRNGSRDRRPRVEHAQHLDEADVPRFPRIGAIASMQPLHKFEDGGYAVRALGAERAAGSYRFRDLLDAGAVLAFGSDWPIVSLDPFAGIHAAVTGRTRTGAVWLAEQRVSLAEALQAYTLGAAQACFMEDRLGRIAPGYYADLTVLDRDPFETDVEALREVRAAATVIAGTVVWSKEP